MEIFTEKRNGKSKDSLTSCITASVRRFKEAVSEAASSGRSLRGSRSLLRVRPGPLARLAGVNWSCVAATAVLLLVALSLAAPADRGCRYHGQLAKVAQYLSGEVSCAKNNVDMAKEELEALRKSVYGGDYRGNLKPVHSSGDNLEGANRNNARHEITLMTYVYDPSDAHDNAQSVKS